jgi:hypothetical protein
MITTRKETNCSKNRIEPQELPHIITKRKRMEKEQELNNTQFFCATIPTHKPKKMKTFVQCTKPKKRIVVEGDDFFCKH